MWIDKILDCIGLVRKSQIIIPSEPIIKSDISAEDKRENTILLKNNDIYSLCHRCIELLKQNKDRFSSFKVENSRCAGLSGHIYILVVFLIMIYQQTLMKMITVKMFGIIS